MMISSGSVFAETVYSVAFTRDVVHNGPKEGNGIALGARVEKQNKYFSYGAQLNTDVNGYVYLAARHEFNLFNSGFYLAPFIGPSIYYANQRPDRGSHKVYRVSVRGFYGSEILYQFDKFSIGVEVSHVTDLRGKNMYGYHSWDNSGAGPQVLLKIGFK